MPLHTRGPRFEPWQELQRKATWNSPPIEWTKLNVDASFMKSSGVGFTALVCKVSSPLAAEALALREAAFQSDCQILVCCTVEDSLLCRVQFQYTTCQSQSKIRSECVCDLS
ncbi:hypothetical protein PIB30_017744 [Stylosanthes scabra]|uniref:RNase H type-1 domain-containing protein n=1 Tax=Stylosanthes scabra TaxID=79078 RepID=A0ABU6S7S1_9FABA|nr:hypothetical protein [Stylosanthes scabra]